MWQYFSFFRKPYEVRIIRIRITNKICESTYAYFHCLTPSLYTVPRSCSQKQPFTRLLAHPSWLWIQPSHDLQYIPGTIQMEAPTLWYLRLIRSLPKATSPSSWRITRCCLYSWWHYHAQKRYWNLWPELERSSTTLSWCRDLNKSEQRKTGAIDKCYHIPWTSNLWQWSRSWSRESASHQWNGTSNQCLTSPHVHWNGQISPKSLSNSETPHRPHKEGCPMELVRKWTTCIWQSETRANKCSSFNLLWPYKAFHPGKWCQWVWTRIHTMARWQTSGLCKLHAEWDGAEICANWERNVSCYFLAWEIPLLNLWKMFPNDHWPQAPRFDHQ